MLLAAATAAASACNKEQRHSARKISGFQGATANNTAMHLLQLAFLCCPVCCCSYHAHTHVSDACCCCCCYCGCHAVALTAALPAACAPLLPCVLLQSSRTHTHQGRMLLLLLLLWHSPLGFLQLARLSCLACCCSYLTHIQIKDACCCCCSCCCGTHRCASCSLRVSAALHAAAASTITATRYAYRSTTHAAAAAVAATLWHSPLRLLQLPRLCCLACCCCQHHHSNQASTQIDDTSCCCCCCCCGTHRCASCSLRVSAALRAAAATMHAYRSTTHAAAAAVALTAAPLAACVSQLPCVLLRRCPP
jgi:hypothetical protein